jgi:hypothetical protein
MRIIPSSPTMAKVVITPQPKLTSVEFAWPVIQQEGLIFVGQQIQVTVSGTGFSYCAEICSLESRKSGQLVYNVTIPAAGLPRYLAFPEPPNTVLQFPAKSPSRVGYDHK